MKTINTEKIPIKLWCENIEEGALRQTRNLANHPAAYGHIAIMPDAHQGYGMPIGGVLASGTAVIPNAVGVDIGCGVRAALTTLSLREILPVMKNILNNVQRSVPSGFEHHKKPQKGNIFEHVPDSRIIKEELESARRQLGTLGGGNHFIEFQKDKRGQVWIMIHSGSRNLGKKVADFYNRKAIELNAKTEANTPLEWQLAYFPIGSREAEEYLAAMNYCLGFAKENRRRMMEAVKEIVTGAAGDFSVLKEIDVHHNYAAREVHQGKELLVHRKGAVRAVGEVIVPGSMGSHSYTGWGLANPDSFCSCSHGAGRIMGRNEARKKIRIDDVIAEMREKEIFLYKSYKADLAEECSSAYKDIDLVMKAQADLVEARDRLEPLGVVKG